tara:strand:+ start:567 stop:677 length:111 start_codon:yes stop_codon:yes gene_type:complete
MIGLSSGMIVAFLEILSDEAFDFYNTQPDQVLFLSK